MSEQNMDVYFSADVETDGPIPGQNSLLSFAFVYAGCYDGNRFERPTSLDISFYRELYPTSNVYAPEALKACGLNRSHFVAKGVSPAESFVAAAEWIKSVAQGGTPVLVGYPLGFDWMWLQWYFIKYTRASPFGHSHGFDTKTAWAMKSGFRISLAGRAHLPPNIRSVREHTHHALDDAKEQAEIFANVMRW